MFAETLGAHLVGVCELSRQQVSTLFGHYQLFCRWNRVLNLSSVVELEAAVLRHYCESLFLAAHLPETTLSVVDVGSGAGFPGIPLAVFRPNCRVTLVESHRRKAVFLREATRDVANVEVVARRAEEVDARFDWLVARGVAWRDLRAFALRSVARVALLTSTTESRGVDAEGAVEWKRPVPLPWRQPTVLLVGQVPRETC
ncbi:MAG: 16S rRNA (guanine(527)-N(7))-methyltransferase RsmG [Bryobacteraceae bacterium]